MRFQKHKAIIITTAAAMLVLVAGLAGASKAAIASAPVNTGPPSITGTAKVGQTLTASNGSWSNNPTDYAYAWLRCNTSGAACISVPDGTQKSYTLSAADAGHQMRVRVTASNTDGSSAAQSDPTATVVASTVPRNTDRPIVSGTPELGQVLTTDNGSWTESPTSYSYQWQRCEADNFLSCANISAATQKTYTTRAIDVGYRVRSQVTAKNADGSAVATSAATAVIRPKLKITNGRPTLAIISVRVLGHTVYARFRVCDDSNKNLTIIQTTSRPGALSYSRRFSTLTAPMPCGVYTRHWSLVSRFRGHHRITVTLLARDKSGSSSAKAHRTLTRG